MPATFRVDVVAPDALVWSGQAEFLSARTLEGEIGVMADHEPTLAGLATGPVIIDTGSERLNFGVHGGFLQVLRNQVTVLGTRARLVTGGREEATEMADQLAEQASGDDLED